MPAVPARYYVIHGVCMTLVSFLPMLMLYNICWLSYVGICGSVHQVVHSWIVCKTRKRWWYWCYAFGMPIFAAILATAGVLAQGSLIDCASYSVSVDASSATYCPLEKPINCISTTATWLTSPTNASVNIVFTQFPLTRTMELHVQHATELVLNDRYTGIGMLAAGTCLLSHFVQWRTRWATQAGNC
eukprot:TRINITY_DN7252_c0_g1_i1.p1 TRINITY_DN7252_c0_g1~~TRINITY_DN7252_c0_g1_i1.p1  ORF type:complete len:197 (+),score=6.90 TRINITY_DN7252_c0_g1_i1:33-593(+)